MILAKELCGRHVGLILIGYGRGDQIRSVREEAITMITHKKNGWVLVRTGPSNAQYAIPGDRAVVL